MKVWKSKEKSTETLYVLKRLVSIYQVIFIILYWLIDIVLSTDQITSMFETILEKCKENNNSIEMSRVIQLMVDHIKEILDRKQIAFVASHGTRFIWLISNSYID